MDRDDADEMHCLISQYMYMYLLEQKNMKAIRISNFSTNWNPSDITRHKLIFLFNRKYELLTNVHVKKNTHLQNIFMSLIIYHNDISIIIKAVFILQC